MDTIIKPIFNEFARAIIWEYSIKATPEELYAKWNQTIKSITVGTLFSKTLDETHSGEDIHTEEEIENPAEQSKAKPAKKVQETKDIVENTIKCPYSASRGSNAGKKCEKTAAKGSLMCSTHKKHADKYPSEDEVQGEDSQVAPPQKEKPVITKGCDYVFTRGANKNSRCGSAQVKDTCFCSKHQKETEKPAKKDALPKPKPVSEEKIVFSRDEQHFVMRGPRPLVCKSASEKIIIGKKVGGVIIPLDEEDIEFCVNMKLKHDSPAKKTLEELLDEVQGVNHPEEVSDEENDVEDDVEGGVMEEEEILEEED
jgi:hypothetical protein